MAREIKVQPSDIWGYFTQNAMRLQTTQLPVAYDDELAVYITNDDGVAVFTVYDGDDPTLEHEAYGEDDITEQYILALSEIGIDIAWSGGDAVIYDDEDAVFHDETEEEFDIRLRETELNNMVQNMIYDILDNDINDISTEEIEQATFTIKEAVCDILAHQYGLPVYRPMFLIDPDTKEKFFEEYPYPCIIQANS